MRALLINLPHEHRLQRRYVASYYAPNFLVPPLELMTLGAVARQRDGWDITLLDCMAEELDLSRTLSRVRALCPDVVLTMLGFEVCGDDLDTLALLRRVIPRATVLAFGYLTTQRPEEALGRGACDALLLNEPEATFDEVLERIERGEPLAGLTGLATLEDGELTVGPERPRILDLDALPFADHTLIKLQAYNESFMPRPTGAIMSARGCAFGCTYCVRTFGRKMAYRSAESLAEEVLSLRDLGIDHVRFLDDTFTIKRARVLELCQRLSHQPAGLTWTALTRLDRVDPELLSEMYRAGCRRLYVGVESISDRILKLYNKGLSAAQIRAGLAHIRASGIECSAFFIVGAPDETPEEIEQNIEFALEADPDYIIVTRIQYWPGTDLHEAHRHKLRFSMFPTSCEPVPGEGIMTHREYMRWEQKFYRRFYIRPRYMMRRMGTLLRTPADVLEGLGRLASFVTSRHRTRDFI